MAAKKTTQKKTQSITRSQLKSNSLPKKSGKSPSKPKTAKNKTITIDTRLHKILEIRKEELTEKLGGRVTYNMVLQSYLNDHQDLINVRKELETIKQEADKTQEFIRDLLEKAVSNPMPMMAMPATTYPMNGTGVLSSNPPPPPPTNLHSPPSMNNFPKPPPPKDIVLPDLEEIETAAEVQEAFDREKRAIFDGQIRKPSEILQITKPTHANSDVKNFDGTAPSLVKHSHALRNADKFRKGIKREL